MGPYFRLTKFGIVAFVLITGAAGYLAAVPSSSQFALSNLFLLLSGLYFVSSGSFALNQAQEWRADQKMPRTAGRPVANESIQPWQAYSLAFAFIFFGLLCLYSLSPVSGHAALLTVALYNGLYTLHWKKAWAFGAVPGAIPGAMPVVIGFGAGDSNLLSGPCLYLFIVMFLWQMPHFWSLAIRYRDDYVKGGFPVLPSVIGVERTLYHMGLYIFAYVGIVFAAPLFTITTWMHSLIVVPVACKLMWEFFRYFRNNASEGWLRFFLWINVSLLVFVAAPVIEKWVELIY